MEIDLTLPMAAESLIPHRMPMRLVDTLISWSETSAEILAEPTRECILVSSDGILNEAALVELMAQGYAVVKGYDDLRQGKKVSEGYLVGVRKLHVLGKARAGERLFVRIRTVGTFEGFAVAEGEVVIDNAIVAHGTIKLWIVNDAAGGNA